MVVGFGLCVIGFGLRVMCYGLWVLCFGFCVGYFGYATFWFWEMCSMVRLSWRRCDFTEPICWVSGWYPGLLRIRLCSPAGRFLNSK